MRNWNSSGNVIGLSTDSGFSLEKKTCHLCGKNVEIIQTLVGR